MDFYIERGHGDNPVVITLSQSSVGARACVGIQAITSGIDWESGQIRIEPLRQIIDRKNDRDKAMAPRYEEIPNGSRVRELRLCPECGEILRKDDCFCSRCGRKVSG